MSDGPELNVKGLEQLLKALKKKPPIAKVGILGDTGSRPNQNGLTNAQIGAWHEFGTSRLPQRSFLRVPISDELGKRLESSGALDKDVLRDVIAEGTVLPWLKKIAVLAEAIVIEAFSSNGFGKWSAWRGGYTNKTGQILVDTQQLRNSITSEVKDE